MRLITQNWKIKFEMMKLKAIIIPQEVIGDRELKLFNKSHYYKIKKSQWGDQKSLKSCAFLLQACVTF